MRRGAGVTGRIIGAASSGKRRRGSCVSSKLVDDVAAGPITETDAQHAARHRRMQRGCPRCVYNANRRQLESSWGSYKHASSSDMGGAWGVGCKFCDFLRQRCLDANDHARREGNAKPKRRRGPNDANTRWARFEIRSEEQIVCRGVRQHSETQQHRIAARVYLSPDSAVTVLEPTAADAELFRGSVPQLDDWLLAWHACSTRSRSTRRRRTASLAITSGGPGGKELLERHSNLWSMSWRWRSEKEKRRCFKPRRSSRW